MKRKIIFGIAAGMFAIATVFSFNLSNANGAGNVSLNDIAVMAQAGDETPKDTVPSYRNVYTTNEVVGYRTSTGEIVDKEPTSGTYTEVKSGGYYKVNNQSGEVVEDKTYLYDGNTTTYN